jgi:hypothetical protein
MSGTFLGKSLADGQLASSAGDLYTCPASTVAYVKKAIFANTNASARTITIYLTRSGSSDRIIAAGSLEQNETLEVENLILSDGDKIRGVASAATSVDYTLMGVEET